MSAFDILDPETVIDQNLFLEASAGCGKTFTIEHLALRLIQGGVKFEEIVIVTFTKKGAQDLKERILATLKKEGIQVNPDEGNITTIHGFALKRLQEDPFCAKRLYDTLLNDSQQKELIFKFLNTLEDYFPFEEAKSLLLSLPKSPKIETLLEIDVLQKPFKGFLKEHLEAKGFYSFDDLIQDFYELTCHPEAIKSLHSRFKVGIIDEFQDTDPVQWEIFKNLFLHKKGRLYLVGDPKQSIYKFRKADIYTYLDAQRTLGEASKRTLSTNYRSEPSLIESLNTLFSIGKTPSFLPLPTLNDYLPTPPVSAPEGMENSKTLGEWASLQCFTFDQGTEEMLAFTADAIQKLRKNGVPLNSIAILVDKNDFGKEIEAYLSCWEIPTVLIQDNEEGSQSFTYALEDLMKGVQAPNHDRSLKSALSTPFFSWSIDDLKTLQDLTIKEEIVWKFLELKKSLSISKPAFVKKLLATRLKKNSVLEHLLNQKEGEAWLDFLHFEDKKDDPVTPANPSLKIGVQIITFHKSKGLEYDVVFPLGLGVKRKVTSWQGEDLAERLRVLYVALTRAKKQLFIPLNEQKKRSDENTLFGLFQKTYLQDETLDSLIQSGFSIIKANPSAPYFLDKQASKDLLPPIHYTLNFPSKQILSFSQIKNKLSTSDTIRIKTTEEMLPIGAHTGILFHELFEKIPLTLTKEASSYLDYLPFVQSFVKNSLWEPWKETIAKLLEQSFNLTPQGTSFKFKDINESKSFREIEFFHPHPSGYMTGVIDWLFEYEGNYYIVDWKTNALADFEEDTLKQVMEEEDYDLQAKIYKDAAEKYLERFDQGKIAAIYYVFVRGGKVWKAN